MAGDQGPFDIFRFNQSQYGYIAIPSGRWAISNGESYRPYQPNISIEYVWHDMNGNGKYEENEYIISNITEEPYRDGSWIDDNGDIWTPYRNHGIRGLELIELDSFGNPIYTFNPRQFINPPYPMTDIHFIRYFVDTDTMYLAGFTVNNVETKDTPSQIHTICRFDNFLNKTGKMSFIWETEEKYWNITNNQQSWDIAGDYIFTVGVNNNHDIHAWSILNGSPPNYYGTPTEIGRVDICDSGYKST